MGALAPLTHWLPQDDLLLKNAVEAGASLEVLAKGAVQFSRRFTVQELRNRWYSLLYDPVVAVEASIRMIESELSVSTVQSKKIENNKEAICISGKRKAESVRKCYYAMRKRICGEPFYSMDLTFLGEPGYGSAGNEPISTNCLIGDQVSNDDGIQELNFGVENGSLVELGTNEATSSADDFSAAALCTGICDHDNIPLGQSNQVLDICPPDKNLSLTGDPSSNNELGPSKELQDFKLLDSMDLEAQHQHMFDETNDNEAIVCSGSGCQVFNPSSSGCLSPLENALYSSPLPQMPVMDTGGSVSASTFRDAYLENNVPLADSNLQILDVVDGTIRSSFLLKSEMVHQTSGCMMELPHSEDNFSEQVILENLAPNAEEYFEQLSNSLLSFTPEDELLLMDADGKDIIDNLSSLLLDYPDESDMQNLGLSEASVTPLECFNVPCAAHHGESADMEQYHCGDQQLVWNADHQKLSSALTVNPMFPELRNGVICCTLNTEDTEIPNNDDVFLPICMTSTSMPWMENAKSSEVYYPVPFSVMEFTHNHKASVPYQEKEQLPSEMGPNYHINDTGLRFELPCSDVTHMLKKTGNNECMNQAIITQVNKTDINPGSLKESLKKVELAESGDFDKSGDSHILKQTEDFDTHLTVQKDAAVRNREADCTSGDKKNDVIHAELFSTISTVPKNSINCTLSDQELFSHESDSEVPYFSDVEAMILDMDLCPDDLVIHQNPGVLRYQHEGAKRTIVRLEQAAEAFMQRSIAVQGAFAVLYGRYAKYFVKKPEVLLGRETEDVKVDIDLGREARASKISRRQATLKLESDGTFHLRNHGKFPIFVNGKGIMPGETISLLSGCLIEIRGLTFVFETNKKLCKAVV